MTLFIAIAVAVAAGLSVLLISELIPARSPEVGRRVADVAARADDAAERRRRQVQRGRLQGIVDVLGQRLQGPERDRAAARELLTHAGYRSQQAAATYWGIRAVAGLVPAAITGLVAPVLGATPLLTLVLAVYLGAIGYVLPLVVVRAKARKRQKEITLALPDILDLLVVCVEGGMGLNQAFVRVTTEIAPISAITAEELRLLNLEIRAGRPRDESLRNLAARTGVDDLRALAITLIQADRFGTSVANALRVHSETLRDKRRQRAEEAAAKTTIKLVFPLVLFIFPALLVVLAGSAVIQLLETLGQVTGP